MHALPNIEHHDKLIRSQKDRPTPAGFAPYDVAWPQRMSKAGTHDKKWLKTRFPGFAEDMDWTMFNAAPDDQQNPGYFSGDEAFVLENMHPGKSVLEGGCLECASAPSSRSAIGRACRRCRRASTRSGSFRTPSAGCWSSAAWPPWPRTTRRT